MKTPQMCSERRYGSIDMQRDFFRSGHDLNLDLDLGQLFNMTFLGQNIAHPTRLDKKKHDVCKTNVVHLPSQELLSKNVFRKNDYF